MRKIKRVSVLVLVVLMAFALIGCQADANTSAGTDASSSAASQTSAGTETGATSVDTIKIGAIFPLSGTGADNGQQNINGAELAVKLINEAGGIKALGGAQLELVPADNMSDTNQCKAVAERLLADEDIVACIGAAASAYVIPMLPVFEKAEIPFVTAQLADAITSQGYQWVFETTARGGDWGAMQIEFIKWLNEKYDLGITKVGIIVEDTEWGLSNAAGGVKTAEGAGLEVVYNESFPAGSADVSALITGLIESGAQIVIPSCYTQDAKNIVNTMNSMNYHPIIMGGGGGFLYPAFVAEFGEGVVGIVSTSADNWDTANAQELEMFDGIPEMYMDIYGEFMAEQAVGSFGNIYIIAQALEEAASSDPADIQEALRNININTVFPGGNVDFDETGLNVNAVPVIVQWQKMEDGSIVPRTVYPESVATADYILPEGMGD